jgi:mono/diheme cytochrome c family protein
MLGFSAIQLTHPTTGNEVDLFTLAAEGKLSAAPADGGYPVPGTGVTQAALGYLHANCGNCHNPTGISFNNPFSLHLLVDQRTPAATSPYLTAVGVPVERYIRPGITHRVAPGDPGASCIPARMSQRVSGEQMPPVGTKYVDDAGVATIRAWILTLP